MEKGPGLWLSWEHMEKAESREMLKQKGTWMTVC